MNSRIKALCVAAAATVAIGTAYTVSAQDNGQKLPFPELKQRVIQRLTTELNCVQAANDEAALRACRPQHR